MVWQVSRFSPKQGREALVLLGGSYLALAAGYPIVADTSLGVDRMREMIRGLLAYSRIESRAEPFETIDLNEVFEAARRNLQGRLDESGAGSRSVDDV